jgi:iron complex transport system substrate-binding protein
VLKREGLDPKVVSLHAHDLAGMFGDLRLTAEALGRPWRGVERGLRARIEAVSKAVKGRPRRRVFCLEWLDPPFVSGHWVPEMVERAGGRDPLARPGKASRRTTWEAVAAAAPEVLFVLPCGMTLDRAERELPAVMSRPEWAGMPAVRSGEAYLVDGPSFFNGAGPRLVDGTELLASLMHPGSVPRPRRGWRRIKPCTGR